MTPRERISTKIADIKTRFSDHYGFALRRLPDDASAHSFGFFVELATQLREELSVAHDPELNSALATLLTLARQAVVQEQADRALPSTSTAVVGWLELFPEAPEWLREQLTVMGADRVGAGLPLDAKWLLELRKAFCEAEFAAFQHSMQRAYQKDLDARTRLTELRIEETEIRLKSVRRHTPPQERGA